MVRVMRGTSSRSYVELSIDGRVKAMFGDAHLRGSIRPVRAAHLHHSPPHHLTRLASCICGDLSASIVHSTSLLELNIYPVSL